MNVNNEHRAHIEDTMKWHAIMYNERILIDIRAILEFKLNLN